jgi:competence protein ComEC
MNATGVAALVLFSGLGWLRFHVSQTPLTSRDLRWHRDSFGEVIFYGRTVGEPDIRPQGTHLVLAADSIAYPDSVCARTGRVLVRFRFDPGIGPDSRVAIRGRLVPPPAARNPGDFSWRAYLMQRGLHGLLEPARGSPVLAVESTGPGWRSRVVAPVRRVLKHRLAAHLHGEEATLLLGLLLGEREQMNPETVDAFRRTGTLHLLAVSGSNVAVVAGIVWGVLLFVRVRRAARLVLAGLCVVLFCFLAHSEASVVRATFAGLLVLGGLALRRSPDPLNLWGFALLVLLAWEPAWLFDVGFQLSFAATLGILLVAPHLPRVDSARGLGRVGRMLATSLAVSTSAQIATLPILASVFNEVPLVAPLANLICVPISALATSGGVLLLLCAPFGDSVLGVASAAAWVFVRILLLAVLWVDGLGVSAVQCASPGAPSLFAFGALALSALALATRPAWRRRIAYAWGVALCGWLGLGLLKSPEPELQLLAGQDSAVMAHMPSGDVWLFAFEPGFSDLRAARAALHLGWSAPSRRVDLKAAGEPDTQSSTGVIPYASPGANAPDPGRETVCVLCRTTDSLPIAVAVKHAGAAVVVCTDVPAAPPFDPGFSGNALWLTNSPRICSTVAAWNGPDRCVCVGRAAPRPADGSVQILHTGRADGLRIFWRDGSFQVEPRVR